MAHNSSRTAGRLTSSRLPSENREQKDSVEPGIPQTDENFYYEAVPISELPEILQDTEPYVAVLYPDFLPMDTERNFPMKSIFNYRGTDAPAFKTFSGGRIENVMDCMIHFRDVPGLPNNGLFGVPETPAPGETVRIVRNGFLSDSQVPAMQMSVNRGVPEEPWATADIFAQALAHTTSSIGISFFYGSDPLLGYELPEHKRLQQMVADVILLRIDVDLHDAADSRGELSWRGISDLQLHQIIETYAKSTSPIPYCDQIIALLSQSRKFTIYRCWDRDDMDCLTPFCQYMRSIMYAAANLGSFWWWKLHAGTPLQFSNDPCTEEYTRLAFPRWLAEEVRIKYEYDYPESYETVKFANLTGSGIFPDKEAEGFHHRLQIAYQKFKKEQAESTGPEPLWLGVGKHPGMV